MGSRAWIGPLLLTLAATVVSADPDPPRPTPAPRPAARLQLDVERHAEDVVERQPESPRFSSSVDVLGRSRQTFLEAHFQGLDLECGAAQGGAPTLSEMQSMRPHMSPSANLLGLAQLALSQLKSSNHGEGPYFLYRLRSPDGVKYLVREGRLPGSSLYAAGAEYELIQTFSDRGSAVHAWRQLERGIASNGDSSAAASFPGYMTNCRPGRH